MKTSCATTQHTTASSAICTRRLNFGWRSLFVWTLLAGMVAGSSVFAQPMPAVQGTQKPEVTAPVSSPIGLFITSTTRILPGSLLHVEVKDEDDLSGDLAVDAEGKISFTMSDSQGVIKETWKVAVAKMTSAEAKDAISESLKKYLRVPEVQVAIINIPHTRIELWGSGCKPGPVDLPLESHLSDILSYVRTNADFGRILIVRRVEASQVAANGDAKTATVSNVAPPSTRTLVIDFTAYQLGESTVDPPLQNGDKIYIQLKPETRPAYTLRTVRVVGEVGREADIPFTPGMTVKDAITSAGGVKDTADKNHIRLHQGESGHDYDLKIAGVMGNDPDVNMKLIPGDYIYVMKTDLRLRWGIDGEVQKRDIFPYTPGQKITVSSAIALVGGMTKKGDPRRSVLRKGYLIDPTKTHDIVFDYEAIQKKKQQDFEVEAGDLVVILPRPKHPTVWQQLLPLALHLLPFPF